MRYEMQTTAVSFHSVQELWKYCITTICLFLFDFKCRTFEVLFLNGSLPPEIEHQNKMPTDHEEPCGFSHRSFCLNGGICYVIPTVPSPFCRCIENYTGARCEEVFLPSTNIQTKSELFATFLALAILLGVLTIGAVYFLCRKGHLQRANSAQYGVGLVETGSSNAYNNSDEDLVFQEDKTFSPELSHSSLQDLNVQDRLSHIGGWRKR
ncbi:pro-neuregulin-4, membrane-bound isoform isoform X2 [Tachyglossus aculeatus]|uniref:pro-neuregulin-4, membrane-bound isoform isoform X2 n=1 Tax=Tachyglossus aculeatus TaxID=9261 RepID=UPI0018F6F168|nr:pro-neuregulin-4, membrane-bound isoform isoform X2 [Tachyglossus aculeatus]